MRILTAALAIAALLAPAIATAEYDVSTHIKKSCMFRAMEKLKAVPGAKILKADYLPRQGVIFPGRIEFKVANISESFLYHCRLDLVTQDLDIKIRYGE